MNVFDKVKEAGTKAYMRAYFFGRSMIDFPDLMDLSEPVIRHVREDLYMTKWVNR